MKPAELSAAIQSLHRAGVPDAEIARRAGIGQATVWRIRNGEQSRMMQSTVERLATSIRDLGGGNAAPLEPTSRNSRL